MDKKSIIARAMMYQNPRIPGSKSRSKDISERHIAVATSAKPQQYHHAYHGHYQRTQSKPFSFKKQIEFQSSAAYSLSNEEYIGATAQVWFNDSALESPPEDDTDIIADNWDSIVQISFYTADQEISCPICLDSPSVPRTDKCGHVYCLPCLHRFLSYDNGLYKKCALCNQQIDIKRIKRASFIPRFDPIVGDQISMMLMKRNKSDSFAVPISSNKRANIPFVGSDNSRFSNIAICPTDDWRKIIELERSTLERELAELIEQDNSEIIKSIFDSVESIEQELSIANLSMAFNITDNNHNKSDVIPVKFDIDNKNDNNKNNNHNNIQNQIESIRQLNNIDNNKNNNNQSTSKSDMFSLDFNEFPPIHTPNTIDNNNFNIIHNKNNNKNDIIINDNQNQFDKFPHEIDESASIHSTNQNSINKDQNPLDLIPFDLNEFRSIQQSHSVYYQSEDGGNVFLCPLNWKMMIHEFLDSGRCLPTRISGRLIELERFTVGPEFVNRYRYLKHLPFGVSISFVDIDLSDWVSDETRLKFDREIQRKTETRVYKEKVDADLTKQKIKHENSFNSSVGFVCLDSLMRETDCIFDEDFVPLSPSVGEVASDSNSSNEKRLSFADMIHQHPRKQQEQQQSDRYSGATVVDDNGVQHRGFSLQDCVVKKTKKRGPRNK